MLTRKQRLHNLKERYRIPKKLDPTKSNERNLATIKSTHAKDIFQDDIYRLTYVKGEFVIGQIPKHDKIQLSRGPKFVLLYLVNITDEEFTILTTSPEYRTKCIVEWGYKPERIEVELV